MQKIQEEIKERMEKGQQEMQKCLEDMQKSQEETKVRMENMQEIKNELKERMEKGQQELQKGQEVLRNTLEKKIDSVEEKVALKVEEKKVREEIGKIKGQVEEIGRILGQVEEIGRIKEQDEERIEEVAGNFTQRVEDLEKKLLACGNTKNESKLVPASSVPMTTSPVPLTASPVPVKHSTYNGKTNWEVYKTQFSIISEANGWTEGVKACQLATSLRGEAAEILQTLLDTERLNLSSLYNVLDLRFGLKYSKDNAPTVRETISLQYFVDGLRKEEVQKAVRVADVQDLKSALLYALKSEAGTQASRRDRQSIRGAIVTLDAPCESLWKSDIEKLRDEFQTFKSQRQN
ncbi:uncharacterized protein TNCV_3564801 [Trichonephila clavipes]|nr:uncharacterized protein TNCV_3564801 [Trichonephila clavipes]